MGGNVKKPEDSKENLGEFAENVLTEKNSYPSTRYYF